MKKHAFTLVELLVVVTIIGILIALLLPALAAARALAEQTVCLSNERQCALGFLEYANEYQGTIITNTTAAYSGNGHEDFWPSWMCLHVNCFGQAMPMDQTFISPSVAVCPMNPAPLTVTNFSYDAYAACMADWYTQNTPGVKQNLAFMQTILAAPPGSPSQTWLLQVERLPQIPQPVSTILLSDSYTAWNFPYNGAWQPGEQFACFLPDTTAYAPYSGGIFSPHGGSVAAEVTNCAFYDGHAASLSPGQLFQTADRVTQFYNYAHVSTQIVNGVPIQ